MSRLPPHKRDLHALYWAHFWAYERYLREGPVTEDETQKHLAYLDMLWDKMSLGCKKMIDPLWETTAVQGGEWRELRALQCPHCGWIQHVTPGSSGPPRCPACMLDMAVHTKDVEIEKRLQELQLEKQKILAEGISRNSGRLVTSLLNAVINERDQLLELQARLKGAGVE